VAAKADTFTARVRPTIEALRTEGKSLHQIAAELTARGVMTARGGQWDATRVRNVLVRAGLVPPDGGGRPSRQCQR
jgi:Recombinase